MPVQRQIAGLLGWLAITFVAAAIGALASADAGEFYDQLARPTWAPPAWMFAPVWTALYVLMAIAAWLVWRRAGFAGAAPALVLYLVQLAANALWTWLFFVWHEGLWALAEIVVLWFLILATGIGFWRATPVAGALLLPYWLWVSLAFALTLATWRLNPQLLG